MSTELCELFLKHRSDKFRGVGNGHSYSKTYYEILSSMRDTVENVLEIGVGNPELMLSLTSGNYKVGASLYAWRDFFNNSMIFGLDIRKDVLFEDDRIKCFYTDQSNSEELLKTIDEICEYSNKDVLFDLIIDDGSHIVDNMLLSFDTLFNHLKVGGIYIIEDIQFKDLDQFVNIDRDNASVVKIHQGLHDWDSFIAYERIR